MCERISEICYLAIEMSNYYFLSASLPALYLTIPPEISFEDLVNLQKDNLSPQDYAKTKKIRLFYDIQNIRALWKNEEFDPRGNLDEVELEEALISQLGLPDYVFEFLGNYESKEQRLKNFPGLIAAYFRNEARHGEGFLKEYLTFEREWRLVFTAYRAKLLGRNLEAELQFEDPDDDLIAQILAQKDSLNFVPPEGYEDLLALFEAHSGSPLELHKALCEYRFKRVSALTGVDLFSIDRILRYMIQLIIVEKWMELNQAKGMEIINNVLAIG